MTTAIRSSATQGRFDDDDEDDRDDWFDPYFWDDPDDAEEYDPEPGDDQRYDDFDVEDAPDDSDPPPDDLWSDADWD